MMSKEEMSLQEVLGPIMRVLQGLKGQLTFRDEDGSEFVLLSKEYLEELKGSNRKEAQLSFDDARSESDEIPTPIEAYEEERYDDLALPDEADYPEAAEDGVFMSNRGRPSPPPVRVRFEPLTGDLPPQLQD